MSEVDREVLAKVVQSVTDRWDEPLDEVHDIPQIVNAILASDWLAQVKATARAEALSDHESVVRGLIAQAQREAWDQGYRAGFASGDSGYEAGTDRRLVRHGNPYRGGAQ